MLFTKPILSVWVSVSAITQKNYQFRPKRKLRISVTIGIGRNGKKPFGRTLLSLCVLSKVYLQCIQAVSALLSFLTVNSSYSCNFFCIYSRSHLLLLHYFCSLSNSLATLLRFLRASSQSF